MEILIPMRFFGFESFMYVTAALIGFLVSYYAHKLYKFTSKKPHFYLYTGFVLLSIGFLALAIVNAYSFVLFRVSCHEICRLNLFDQVFSIDDFGFWIYYITSLAAYTMFILMYMPEDKRKSFPVLLFWYASFAYFHLISFLMLSFVAFRSAVNYANSKTTNSLLVLASFLSIASFHLIMLLTGFTNVCYVVAHLLLLFGFLSLLLMLLRVNRK